MFVIDWTRAAVACLCRYTIVATAAGCALRLLPFQESPGSDIIGLVEYYDQVLNDPVVLSVTSTTQSMAEWEHRQVLQCYCT